METDVSPIMGFWTQANTTPSYNTTLVDIGPLPNGSCWSVRNPGPDCFHIWRDIYFYVAAVIMPLGLIFNSVSFGIFFTSWMRHTTPGRYFMLFFIVLLVVLCDLRPVPTRATYNWPTGIGQFLLADSSRATESVVKY